MLLKKITEMCSLVTVGGVALLRGDFDLLQVSDFDLLTQRLGQRRGWVGGGLREVNHTGKVFALAVSRRSAATQPDPLKTSS